jgi:alcohol dehydrogenase
MTEPFPTDVSIPAAAQMTDERCLVELTQVADALRELSAQTVFLVADAEACRHSGAEEVLDRVLAPYRVSLFSEFEPNPKYEDVLRGIEAFQKNPADVVLAVGGGTAIDVAKLIAVLSPQPAGPRSLILKEADFSEPAVPLIAVPTTSGTGSEATQFAVVYLNGTKHSVDDPRLLPAWCVLDPKLTATLPPRITAVTGLDAFCQAIESLWSVRSTDESNRYAREAARLAWEHLPAAVREPTLTSRQAMCRAAHLAGRAINLTRTTASHAISYALTSDHGIPHGHAVALTLGPMLLHNSRVTETDCHDPRGPEHVRRTLKEILEVLGASTAAEGADKIDAFVRSIGCETRLNRLGITSEESLRMISGKVNTERLSNNPRRLTEEQLVSLLQSIG